MLDKWEELQPDRVLTGCWTEAEKSYQKWYHVVILSKTSEKMTILRDDDEQIMLQKDDFVNGCERGFFDFRRV